MDSNSSQQSSSSQSGASSRSKYSGVVKGGDFMQWCIDNGKMNEADLDATLSKPQKNHTSLDFHFSAVNQKTVFRK